MPRSAMRPVDCDAPSDCILVVGVSRPKIAAAFLTVALLSLFLTFHILYDSAVYSLRAAAATSSNGNNNGGEPRTLEQLLLESSNTIERDPSLDTSVPGESPSPSASSFMSASPGGPVPGAKVHFPKTNRHLPQAIIIGVRKCGTRALLEMMFLHPQIQKAAGEVHFFDRAENYEKGLEWYRRKMPYSFKGQVTIEKSPSYFVTPEVSDSFRLPPYIRVCESVCILILSLAFVFFVRLQCLIFTSAAHSQSTPRVYIVLYICSAARVSQTAPACDLRERVFRFYMECWLREEVSRALCAIWNFSVYIHAPEHIV